jgi:hypothetical protein
MYRLLNVIERLDLAYRDSLVGPYFNDIIGVMSIVFGGCLLLFSWKHHRYFLGVTGFLTGCFLGLIFKSTVLPDGGAGHLLYIVLCGGALAAFCLMFERFVGMLMGGFVTAAVMAVIFPQFLQPERHNLLVISIGFMLGGGLGSIFPRIFFITATSLFGAAFVTYGVTGTLLPTLLSDPTVAHRPLWHAVILLPLFIFGLCYQLMTTRRDEGGPKSGPPRKAPVAPQPARST